VKARLVKTEGSGGIDKEKEKERKREGGLG